ncbi:MAG TPA: helix-turn-helix domain-containing protein [Ktedonobacterales bacterium]
MAAAGSGKLLLTVMETCERLGLNRSVVYPLIMRGHIASVKIGKCRRIPAWALDAYVARLAAEQGVEVPPKPVA